MIENITIEELKKLRNINIIDIRNNEKYNDNHILNAINLEMEKLLIYHNKYLNRNNKYYIYCQKGIQSRKLCQLLKIYGYNVVNIVGGYEAWILSE